MSEIVTLGAALLLIALGAVTLAVLMRDDGGHTRITTLGAVTVTAALVAFLVLASGIAAVGA